MIGQPGFFWRDEVGERPARLAAFLIRLLTEEVKSFEQQFEEMWQRSDNMVVQ